jgi:RHS repeat-associated protein
VECPSQGRGSRSIIEIVVETQLQAGYTVSSSGACFTSPFFRLAALLDPEKSRLVKHPESYTNVTGIAVVGETRVRGCEALGYDIASGSPENDFKYVGEQFDGSSGFFYNRARWYDSKVGRFLGADPFAGDPQAPLGLHRYLYANTSPISYTDPSGKITLLEVTVGIATFSILTALSVKPALEIFGDAWQEEPNDDHYITFAEANWKWKHGHGGILTADLGMLDP